MEEQPKREVERRERPRRDADPIHWREIAMRNDRESLPFLHYFVPIENDIKKPDSHSF